MNALAQIIRSCGLFVCVGTERAFPPQDAVRERYTMRLYKVYKTRNLDEIVEKYTDPDFTPSRRLDKQPVFVREEVARRLNDDRSN